MFLHKFCGRIFTPGFVTRILLHKSWITPGNAQYGMNCAKNSKLVSRMWYMVVHMSLNAYLSIKTRNVFQKNGPTCTYENMGNKVFYFSGSTVNRVTSNSVIHEMV